MNTIATPFIRPLSLGELLDQAFRLYRKNFLTLVGIIAIPYIPLGLLQALAGYVMTSSLSDSLGVTDPSSLLVNSNYWLGVLGTYGVLFVQFILVNGVATAALTRAVADTYVVKPVDIAGAYKQLGNSWLRLIGAMLVTGLIIVAAVVWFIIPCVGWFTGLGILYFLSAVVSRLIVPIVVLEKRGGFDAFRRAWDMGRIRFWWMLGFTFVLGLLGQLIVTVPVYLIMFGVQFVLGSQLDPIQTSTYQTVLTSLTTVFTGILYLPLVLTAMTVVYFDLRVRSEGLDLALQAASQTDPEANIVSLAETTPAAPLANFITNTDVAYFVLLSFIFGLVYALFVVLGMATMLPILANQL